MEISNNLLLVLWDAQKCIFSTNSRSSYQAKNNAKTLFVHPPSPFHGNFCNCNSIGICTASQFKFQLLLYTAWSNAYSEIGPEVRCDLSRLLSRKITKRIHSSKPASLNRPIAIPHKKRNKTEIDQTGHWWENHLFKPRPALRVHSLQIYHQKKEPNWNRLDWSLVKEQYL